ncbi:hypothetical protein AtubIFM55763_000754 [Aspergillus tubingensis]|nr:hypothetical protein AtubIFM55763_000754 [Aspergillus tubingensis]
MNPGIDTLCHKLKQTWALWREKGRLIDPPSPAKLNGLIDFSSNDSLSLSTSGALTRAFLNELKKYPAFSVGSTSSRILDGTKKYLLDLERDLAKFHRAETAMFFNSGYDANVALWSTTLGPAFGSCLEKIRTHNSGIATGRQVVFIALESFYSMDGDSAPVVKLLEIAHKALPRKNFIFSIEEAHSNGIVGPNGSGFVCHYGLEEQFPIRLQTCGKALGSTGAALLCNEAIKFALLNYARGVIFSTAPSFVSAAAVRAGYDIIGSKEGEDRRKRLQDNVSRFYQQFTSHPDWPQSKQRGTIHLPTEHTWYLGPFQSPIVPVIPQPDLVVDLGKYLEQAKYWVNTVHYPIVPDKMDRVRIVLHADNTPQRIDHVVDLIMQWATKQGGRQAPL